MVTEVLHMGAGNMAEYLDFFNVYLYSLCFLALFYFSYVAFTVGLLFRYMGKITIKVISSEAKKESHTPVMPNRRARTTAHNIIAAAHLRTEPIIAEIAMSVAEKYVISMMLIPAKINPRK